ncbi:MAG: DNA mismatch repair endonuclease MutL [Gudongella sp.]|nr:DNA mismatch repair endonuclease MutL [Gudongella sp.]
MSKIKLLDNNTISKIAAGEVIERPSSIVKELIENSIDANANQITIEIQDSGISLIRVTDNGEGMNKDDLELAFKRHSTSKLTKIEDLNSCFTMGFRGEALSSIASVSKTEVLSRTKDDMAGIKASLIEGAVVEFEPIGTPVGTTMIIKDLFYNLPVRKKFLKSKNVEENYIMTSITKLAIGNPDISFKYIKDDKVVFTTMGSGNVINTVFQLLGKNNTRGFKQIQIEWDNFKLQGFISDNTLYRSNRNHQYLYVNKRYVVDYRISKIIENQYSSLIPNSRYPLFILFISIDPSLIDVNIHPTKQEIKFIADTNVYENLGKAIKGELNESFNIPKVDFSVNKKEKKDNIPLLWDIEPSKDWSNSVTESSESKETIVFKDFSNLDFSNERVKEDLTEEINYANDKAEVEKFPNLRPIGIVFKTYILAEDALNQSLFIIDQHAAHERVMYERYLDDFKNEKINIQQLLTPEIIELTRVEINKAKDNLKHFQAAGFDVEVFGDNSLILRGIPMIFGKPDGVKLFMEILDELENKLPGVYDTRVHKIIKLACTSAIKAGDTVGYQEIQALFDQLSKCENPFTCPHGRPTIVEMTKKELEKKFLRIQ